MPTAPPSVVVGQALLDDRDGAWLQAVYGAKLASLRPELALVFMMSPAPLEVLFEAALSVGDSSYESNAARGR